jgi:putative ABC transport system permease protein
MTRWALIGRGLVHYWRTNLAVVAGVATAVSVLSGALLVGDSVRGTLRDLAFARLGATDLVLSSTGFVREGLADELAADPGLSPTLSRLAPLVVARATVSVQGSDAGAGNVAVYGVDDRFWRFHGLDADVQGPLDRDAFISPALAGETGLAAGGIALVRLQRPSDVPLESLHGRKEDIGHTVRLTVTRVLPPELLGEFSLQMQQGEVRAVFVPLERLQSELEVGARVNAILASASTDAGGGVLERLVRTHVTLEDLGLRAQRLEARHAVAIDAEAGLVDPGLAAAATRAIQQAGLDARPVLTYLANTIRVGAREVPYSLVTAIDLSAVVPQPHKPFEGATHPPIVLNSWAATSLGARIGDAVTLDYYVWEDPGRLVTRSAAFHLAAIVPVNDADRDLAPTYPGITDSPTLDSWDPPFPLDLRRVRPVDEQYWERHRTTPKGYIPLEVGQQIWSSRYGAMTSLQAVAPADRALDAVVEELPERVRLQIDPFTAGLSVTDVRADAAEASTGATNFGEYFLYFSFFLVVSALLLAALFFKLGVEQRAREVGLLRAVGLDPGAVRRLFLAEALVLALAGSGIGLAGAVAYAWLVITGLSTWWVGAVGTTLLRVHVAPLSLVAGAVGGLGAALGCTWWTLRSLALISERSLLAGDVATTDHGGAGRTRAVAGAVGATVVGIALVAAASFELVPGAGGFFGAGAALLVASLCFCAAAYRSPSRRMVHGRGVVALVRLGLRNASARPARSVLSIAIIASATFILTSVDAFRRDQPNPDDPRSGVGGYALMVETLLPVVHDLSTPEGRSLLNLVDLESATVQPFRLRPGDDASCLNLYRPQNPRILGARADFLSAGRFAFQTTLAMTEAEHANPWLLLQRQEPDGAIPVIGDANSLAYVLHTAVGEDVVIQHDGRDVRLRLVAALRDSIFQSELVMAESNFLELFPDREGYQVMLIATPPAQADEMAATLEDALADFGAEVTTTTGRLAEFHRVENTYLSTFQTLGGLGLLLGTVGLAAILLRNALERRRELALLGAVGYRRGHFMFLLTAESVSLLVAGLAAGAVSSGFAIWPALAARGGTFPLSGRTAVLLGVVCCGGVVATMVAAQLATRSPMLAALRSE